MKTASIEMLNATKLLLDSVKVEEIDQYYNGKANRCHCGCTGNYVKQNTKNKWRFIKMLDLFKSIDPEKIHVGSSRCGSIDSSGKYDSIELSFHITIGSKDYDFFLHPRKVQV